LRGAACVSWRALASHTTTHHAHSQTPATCSARTTTLVTHERVTPFHHLAPSSLSRVAAAFCGHNRTVAARQGRTHTQGWWPCAFPPGLCPQPAPASGAEHNPVGTHSCSQHDITPPCTARSHPRPNLGVVVAGTHTRNKQQAVLVSPPARACVRVFGVDHANGASTAQARHRNTGVDMCAQGAGGRDRLLISPAPRAHLAICGQCAGWLAHDVLSEAK
jgi:hypothetical protein